MTKMTILCVLVLVTTGMLCAPAAAELQNEGDWSFFIIEKIVARTDVKINGHGDRNAGEFQRVHVPASLDRVDVQFDVTWGPDTKLTITREYIDMLRKKYPDRVPLIYAHGCVDTYDVDAGGLGTVVDGDKSYFIATVHEHLKKRGGVGLHKILGESRKVSIHNPLFERVVTE